MPIRTGWTYLDEPDGVIAFAHRGGANHPEVAGLENTLEAFQNAHGLGYRYLETDVHATRDGVLLAFHDAALDRVSDSTGAIADLTYAEVQRALINGTHPVPTFGELVDAFPEARFNIDIKAAAAVPLLAEFILERGLTDRTLVGSFSRRRLREFRRLTQHRVPTSAAPGEVAAYLLLPGRLANRLTGRQVACLQIPHRHRGLRVTSERLVRSLHRVGKQVHVWTIDDPQEMNLLLDLGVDGIFTDRTDILRDVLIARGQWSAGQPRGTDGDQ